MLHGKQGSEEALFINLTPMIDVILTLLVFFMTATKFYEAEEEHLDVKVPTVSAAAAPLTDPPDDLVIQVDEHGVIHFGGSAIELDALRVSLTEARKNYPDQGVKVRADGRSSHQHVADVLSVCYGVGITRTILAVEQKAPAK